MLRPRLGSSFLALGLAALVGCPSEPGPVDGTGSTSTSTSTGVGPTTSGPGSSTQGSGTLADTTAGSTTSSGTTGGSSSGGGSSGGSSSGSSSTSGSSSSSSDGSGSESSSSTGAGACPYTEVLGMPPVTLELVADGFDRPVLALGHPTQPDRLFVVEQGGNVRILEPGEITAPATSFLFVNVLGANNTSIGAEVGLLGFAFHPDFPVDPRVYVSYTPTVPPGAPDRSRISEFMLDPGNPDQVDPASERVILELQQPALNHNGGMIEFGPDGYLYIGMGDGGGGGDTFDTGRDPSVLLSKVLRIGVEPDGMPDDPVACFGCLALGPFDYTVPPDNPFLGDPAFAPEIYAWGVRNPWRFARDPVTGLIYAGDSGQNQWEEVTLIEGGADLGWSDMEAFHCFGGAPCDETAGPAMTNADGITMPLVEYAHAAGRCVVVGGGVYHSCEVPAWDGTFFYSDFCSGELFGLVWDGVTVTDLGAVFSQGELPTGNGWNAYGDVFITTVDAILGGPIFDGKVYRIAPGP